MNISTFQYRRISILSSHDWSRLIFDFEKSKDERIKLNRTFPSWSIFFRFVVGSSLAEGVKIGDRKQSSRLGRRISQRVVYAFPSLPVHGSLIYGVFRDRSLYLQSVTIPRYFNYRVHARGAVYYDVSHSFEQCVLSGEKIHLIKFIKNNCFTTVLYV